MRKYLKIVAMIGFVLYGFFLSGCAVLRPGADQSGYSGAGLNYTGVDFTVLEGKTIVLDPGHGGAFSGAVGPGGLAEKEVNLAIALILRDLLKRYGANVIMTRDTDTTLSAKGAPESVHDDLAARVDSANAHSEAVFFLSLHHNDLGVPNKRYNATETYYKMGDEGPSLDLARYLHRRLMANIGLTRQAIRPGNYYVLRNNRGPAVLGEASYLSHQGTERKLHGQAARQVEAYSYLLGIIDYLSGGIPVIENLQVPGPSPLQDPYPQVVARIYDEKTGLGIDPQRLEVALDGVTLPAGYDQSTGFLGARTLQPLANGTHRASVRVRNLKGNAAREAVLDFQVAVPPAYIRIVSSLSQLPLDGRTPVELTAVAGDMWGRPVVDSTEVLFEFSDPNLPSQAVSTSGGKASMSVIPAVNRPLTVRASIGDVSTEIVLPLGQLEKGLLVVQTMDKKEGRILGWVRINIPGVGFYTTGEDGFLILNGLDEGTYGVEMERDGYRAAQEKVTVSNSRTAVLNAALEPLLGGALLGKKVVIDPQGGLDDPGELGGLGTREADINFAVAAYLKNYLERAGAEVFLTRTVEESPGIWERVIRAENFQGDVLVALAHEGRVAKGILPATAVYHYSSSTNGASMAGLVGGSLRGFAGRPFRGAMPGYQRILQQVSCPAIWVRAASVADPAAEKLLSDPAQLRGEAYAIFNGLAVYFGWKAEGENQNIVGRLSDSSGVAMKSALVMLDGWCPVQSDNEGRFLFRDVESGEHQIDIYYRGKTYGPYRTGPGRRLELVLENK